MGGTVAPSAPNEEYAAGTQLLRAVVPLLNQYVDQEAAEECLEVLQIALGRQGYLPAQLTDLVTSAAPPANCAASGTGGCEGPCGPCEPSEHSYLCPAPAVCEPIQEGLGLPWRWDTEHLNLVTRDGETVIVSLRILGGTVDVSGPNQMEAAQAIATALNAYYRANPAPA